MEFESYSIDVDTRKVADCMEIRTTALHTAKATDAKALGGGVLVCWA